MGQKRDVVVVGASAGGVEALKGLVSALPRDFPAAVVVVVHIPASAESVLPAILTRNGPLPAKRAEHGDRLEHGQIYVAPPDHHVMILERRLRVNRGPRVNGHRPAVDPLFRSAARSLGSAAVGVVLSGALDDGTAGMMALKAVGAATVVQDPNEALYPSMPRSAMDHVAVDHVVPVSEMPKLLARLVTTEGPETPRLLQEAPLKPEDEELELDQPNDEEIKGPPSGFTCPECNGALWEVDDGVLRFRCHVGHVYGGESLGAAQSEALEEAIWAAYRALRESGELARRLAERATAQGLPHVAAQYQARYTDAQERANLIRGVLERGQLFASMRTGRREDA